MPEPGAWTAAGTWISKVFGLAFGGRIFWKVQEPNEYLMNHWEAGSRVDRFGFRRDAYTACLLAAVLHQLGLRPRGNQNLVPYTLRLFESAPGGRRPGDVQFAVGLHRDYPDSWHEHAQIATYDRKMQLLSSGDTLYPVARLAQFCATGPVSFILGAHIEMTDQAGRWFGLGTSFQPGEHMLQLKKHHLQELHDALRSIGAHPRTDRRSDFIIWPSTDPLPALGG